MQKNTSLKDDFLRSKAAALHQPIRNEIAESWKRCVTAGIDPDKPSEEVVVEFPELRERQERLDRLRQLVRPELELLGSQVAGPNYLVAFSDIDGVVLDRIIDTELDEANAAGAVVLGSSWDEDHRGTNALGLSLKTRQSALVTGAEHFLEAHSGISCASSPIFNSQQQIVGLLDATSQIEERQYHTSALVNLACMNISNRLFVEEHRDDLIIQVHPRTEYLTTQSAAMLAFDTDGKLTGANPNAFQLLPGLRTSQSQFEQIFYERFGDSFTALLRGETIRLTDWMRSALFARLRLTRPSPQAASDANSNYLFLYPAAKSRPEITNSNKDGPIFDDECLRQHIRLSTRTCRIGLPVLLHGRPNQGASELAKEIHRQLHQDANFYSINCELSDPGQIKQWLMRTVLLSKSSSDTTTEAGPSEPAAGTLFFDRVNTQWLPLISWITEHCQNPLEFEDGQRQWAILASAKLGSSENPTVLYEDTLWAYCVAIPNLASRSDFGKICNLILNQIAPTFRLSRDAIERLRGLGDELSFTKLSKILLQASEKKTGKVIRPQDMRFLSAGQNGDKLVPCVHCTGFPTKEEKCLTIRKTLRDLNGNISLTARRLNISRNTVYRHGVSLE